MEDLQNLSLAELKKLRWDDGLYLEIMDSMEHVPGASIIGISTSEDSAIKIVGIALIRQCVVSSILVLSEYRRSGAHYGTRLLEAAIIEAMGKDESGSEYCTIAKANSQSQQLFRHLKRYTFEPSSTESVVDGIVASGPQHFRCSPAHIAAPA